MEDFKIVRKNTVANATEKFEFDVEGFEFLVKNFNEFDIFVAFKQTSDTSKMIKIPANCCQNCISAKGSDIKKQYSTKDVYIYAEGSGEVEVQCLRY